MTAPCKVVVTDTSNDAIQRVDLNPLTEMEHAICKCLLYSDLSPHMVVIISDPYSLIYEKVPNSNGI